MKKESKIAAAITAVIDIVTAGLLWLVCSLGVVTVGAASSALYYAVVKCIRHERGGLAKSFFKAFRRDFKIIVIRKGRRVLRLRCIIRWLCISWPRE